MEVLLEQILIYTLVFALCVGVIYFYLKKLKDQSIIVNDKVNLAKLEGLFEPVSLHPHIDLATCIGSAACVAACPEKDIIGIVDGKATVINTSNCVGHGACFHSCPVEAITLRIGTESRGVELPHVNEDFQTNIAGIYIAGELGGMGLIKNSVEQGQQAVDSIVKLKLKPIKDTFDLIIIGAGPAGISAALNAKKNGLKCIVLEQETLGGTVYSFPRSKIVMTSPMNLPLVGKVKLFDTSKDELLKIWNKAIDENELDVRELTKVESITPIEGNIFKIQTSKGETLRSQSVLLAIGRRGTPRKLGVEGEELEKVSYRLLDSEQLKNKHILVVGGGDSAIESAMLLMDENEVVLSYRSDKFARLKPKNKERIQEAIEGKKLKVIYNSNVKLITVDEVELTMTDTDQSEIIKNDLVYIFAGGELPTKFLQNAGIEITKRFGHVVKKHA